MKDKMVPHEPADSDGKRLSAEAGGSGGWTPGPWEFVPSTESNGPYVVNDFGSTIALVYTMIRPAPSCREESRPLVFTSEANANARLIAAAPNMAAALKPFVDARQNSGSSLTVADFDRAVAALFLATGADQ